MGDVFRREGYAVRVAGPPELRPDVCYWVRVVEMVDAGEFCLQTRRANARAHAVRDNMAQFRVSG